MHWWLIVSYEYLSFHLSVSKSVMNAFQHSTKFAPTPTANHALKSEIVSFCCCYSIIIQMDFIHIQRMHYKLLQNTEKTLAFRFKGFKFLSYCICYQIPNKNQIALDMRHHPNDKMFSTEFSHRDQMIQEWAWIMLMLLTLWNFMPFFFLKCLMFIVLLGNGLVNVFVG